MKTYGIKVAKPGEDVSTIPDSPENIKKFSLITIPDFSLLKVKASNRISINNSATQSIAHGLEYTPIAWVFMKDGSNMIPVYDDLSGTYMYVDDTNLVIHNQSGSTKDFYYYIFYDEV